MSSRKHALDANQPFPPGPLIDLIHEPVYEAVDFNWVSKRMLTHWQRQQLLDDKRTKDERFRLFSIADVLWIAVIGELRQFGMPYRTIRKVKVCLIDHPGTVYHTGRMSVLAEGLITIVAFQRPLLAVVKSTGDCSVMDREDYLSGYKKQDHTHHLVIDLYRIIRENTPLLITPPVEEAFERYTP